MGCVTAQPITFNYIVLHYNALCYIGNHSLDLWLYVTQTFYEIALALKTDWNNLKTQS